MHATIKKIFYLIAIIFFCINFAYANLTSHTESDVDTLLLNLDSDHDGAINDETWYETLSNNYSNVVTVAASGGDYTTIQGAIDSITTAGPSNHFLVVVYPGVYTENVTGKNYVDITGFPVRRATKIYGTSGTLFTLPDTEEHIFWIDFQLDSTLNTDIIIDATAGAGATGFYRIENSDMVMSSSVEGIKPKILDIDCGVGTYLINTTLTYTMTGTTTTGIYSPINIKNNNNLFYFLRSIARAYIGAANASLATINDISTGRLLVQIATIEAHFTNAANPAIATCIGAYGAANVDLKQVDVVVLKATGQGSGVGYSIYLDSSSNNASAEVSRNIIDLSGFSNNRRYYIGAGDTLSSYFNRNNTSLTDVTNGTLNSNSDISSTNISRFSNGVRIGTNDTNHMFDEASNGSGSATMYIGNETILMSGDINSTVESHTSNDIDPDRIAGDAVDDDKLNADLVADGSTNAIPTLTQETNWDTAYGWGDHASAGYESHTSNDIDPDRLNGDAVDDDKITADIIIDGSTNAIPTLTQETNWESVYTNFGGITTSANIKTFLAASDYAAMRTQMGIGTSDAPLFAGIQPGNSNLNYQISTSSHGTGSGTVYIGNGIIVTDSFPIASTGTIGLDLGDTYTNYGDSGDNTINKMFDAIDNAWPSEYLSWSIIDSDTDTAIADGKKGMPISAGFNGFDLKDVTCSIADLNSASGGATTIVIRRLRSGTPQDMTSTGVTIGYDEYTASDEVINTSYDDLQTGDLIFFDIDSVTTGAAQKGLSCVLTIGRP